MTVVGAIIDPNPSTRSVFLRSLEEQVWRDGTRPPAQAIVGDCTCRWQTCQTAPVSTAQQGKTTAWVLGHLDGIDAPEQGYAQVILSHFEKKGSDEIACYSGYFLAVVHGEDGYYVFTDRLGLFPCYYGTKGDVLLLGTSSDIPTLHPTMPRKPNWKGIFGHLLCMHEVLGESVWESSYRLGVGQVLHFTGTALRMMRQQAIPISDESFGLPRETQLERSHAATMEAFRPYRGQSVAVLLSGGLDSRLVAGYLSKAGADVRLAYTLGDSGDVEFRCAQPVCHTLKWSQRRVGIDFGGFPAAAVRQIAAEQLANGLNDLSWWSLVDVVEGATAPIITGILGDAVLGGSHIALGYNSTTRQYSFDALFRHVNAWGLPAELLCSLFPHRETREWIVEITERLRECYEALPGYPFQKVWQFDLMNRQRFHVAGILARLPNSIWPLAPLTSNSLLTAAGGMPACAISGRTLQRDLLLTRFPPLARLPLDRNAHDSTPLAPSLGYRLWRKIENKTRMRKLPLRKRENLYYYRVFDINNQGWRLVRAECSRALNSLSGIIDLDVCHRLLLSPEADIRPCGDPIIGVSGIKSLLAWILWWKRHAPAA